MGQSKSEVNQLADLGNGSANYDAEPWVRLSRHRHHHDANSFYDYSCLSTTEGPRTDRHHDSDSLRRGCARLAEQYGDRCHKRIPITPSEHDASSGIFGAQRAGVG